MPNFKIISNKWKNLFYQILKMMRMRMKMRMRIIRIYKLLVDVYKILLVYLIILINWVIKIDKFNYLLDYCILFHLLFLYFIYYLLLNFRGRSAYVEQLMKDMAVYYSYSNYLLEKLFHLFSVSEV